MVPGPNWTVAKLAVQVVNKSEPPTRIQFGGKLPTRLNWAGCQQVAHHIHLYIHIRLLSLQFVNCILSKSCFQQPLIRFCMFCSLQCRLIWNWCFNFDILYFCLLRREIMPYECEDPPDAFITKYATSESVDAPLTFIFGMRQGSFRYCFC